MLFSIIIPVYNIKQTYLNECLASLIEQTYQNFEIILVDDGSSNGCDKWCDEYKKEYPNIITVIHKKNEGVSEARNTGIKAAEGEYLIFADPDDWMDIRMCEYIEKVIRKNDFDILNLSYATEFKNKTILHEENEEIFTLTLEEKKELILKLIDTTNKNEYKNYRHEVFGSVWAKCYRTSFVRENNLTFQNDLTKAQDTVFNLYAFEKARTVIEYKKIIYHYRMVASSITHKYNKKIYDIQKRFLSAVNEFVIRYHNEDLFMNAFYHRVALSYFSILDLDVFNTNNPLSSREKEKHWKCIATDDVFSNIKNVSVQKYSKKSRLVLWSTNHRTYFLLNLLYKLRRIKSTEDTICYE